MKKCSMCHTSKELDEFHKNQYACKECRQKTNSIYIKSIKGKLNELRRKQRDKVKVKARCYLNHGIRDKKIDKPILCSNCKEEKPLHGHHPDYNNPLNVIWLCNKCHRELHNKIILNNKIV